MSTLRTVSHTAPNELTELVSLLEETPGFDELIDALEAGNSGTIDGAWGSASALASTALHERCSGTLLIVLPRQAGVDDYADDLEAFLGDYPGIFPAWDTLPTEHDVTDSVFGRRLRILRQFQSEQPPSVVVTTVAALLQPTPSRKDIAAGTRRISVEDELEPDGFQQWLTDRGFERVTGIQLPGEFAVRGGIVDLFPPDSEDPIRIEFFRSRPKPDPDRPKPDRTGHLPAVLLRRVTSVANRCSTSSPTAPGSCSVNSPTWSLKAGSIWSG